MNAMNNKMSDLNNYLFEAIERLNDDGLSPEELDVEIKRCEAVNKVAQTLINNAALAVKAQEMMYEYGDSRQIDIPLLGSDG